MRHETKSIKQTERTPRIDLSPYLLDDCTFTISELRKARAHDPEVLS